MFDIKYMHVFSIQFNILQNNINEEKNMILNGRMIKEKTNIFMTFNNYNCIFWCGRTCLFKDE